jgi:hypothetical protein
MSEPPEEENPAREASLTEHTEYPKAEELSSIHLEAIACQLAELSDRLVQAALEFPEQYNYLLRPASRASVAAQEIRSLLARAPAKKGYWWNR